MTDQTDHNPGYRGPYADGPPAEDLEVHAPPLDEHRLGDIRRMLLVAVVLTFTVLEALAGRALRRRSTTLAATACDGLIDGFIHLGPTFVKVGQIIASSAGLFPDVLATSARRCLDAVPAFPAEEARRVVEADLGRPIAQLFRSFDDVPLSAASIGQVHACTLSDGRDAVVKIQRPDIARLMAIDLRNGYRLAGLFERTPWGRTSGARGIVEDVHTVTFQELNPALEAQRQHDFRERIGTFGDNAMVTAPEIYWDHCGPHVICMERVYGIPMDQFGEMHSRGIDGQAILRRGAKVWAEAVMIHGPFHGDMHAGNIWALDDGRGCYLDFGIMGELPDEWKQVIKDLFYTCMFDRDFVRVARAYRRVGAVPEGIGTDEDLGALLETILGGFLDDGFGGLDIGELIMQSMELMKNYEASTPQELVLIGKQLLYIDRYTKHLASEYSLTSDPFIVKNVFPAEAKAKAIELGVDLDDATTPAA